MVKSTPDTRGEEKVLEPDSRQVRRARARRESKAGLSQFKKQLRRMRRERAAK